MAQGVAWAAREARRPGDDRRAGPRAEDEDRRDRAARRERDQGAAARWWQTMEEPRHEGVDGLFVHPVEDERGHGRQRHDRARAARGPARRRRGRDPLRRRRADDRNRERGQGAAARDEGLHGRAGDGRAVRRRRRRRRRRSRSSTRRRSSTAPAHALVLPKMWGIDSRARRRRAHGLARRDGRRRCGCSPSACASSPRARARSHSRLRSPAAPVAGKIVCIVSGGNIDSSRLAAILGGETPS